MPKKIIIINGPNLNLIGRREPEIYGNIGFDQYIPTLRKKYPEVSLEYFQSNHEGSLIDKIHEIGFSNDGIIINAGAYSHTSIAIADALRAVPCPVVEVHISDISKRESFRQFSYIKEVAEHFISGLGIEGYEKALNLLLGNVSNQ